MKGEKKTTYASDLDRQQVSGSKNGRRRSRKMESHKQKRNVINLLHSRPPEEEREVSNKTESNNFHVQVPSYRAQAS